MKLDFSKKVESNLKFKPDREIDNGLTLCTISRVYLGEKKYKLETKAEFAGKTVNTLVIEFKSVAKNPTDKPRFHTHVFDVLPSASSSLDQDKVLKMTETRGDQLIHIIGVLQDAPNFNEVPKVNFATGVKDVDEHIKKYAETYQELVNWFNTGGKEGKAVYSNCEFYLKVLPDYPNGFRYEIPYFVGDGFLELVRIHKGDRLAPALEVKPTEPLTLSAKSTKKVDVEDFDNLEDDIKF